MDWASSNLERNETMLMASLSFKMNMPEGCCFTKCLFAPEVEHRNLFSDSSFQKSVSFPL